MDLTDSGEEVVGKAQNIWSSRKALFVNCINGIGLHVVISTGWGFGMCLCVGSGGGQCGAEQGRLQRPTPRSSRSANSCDVISAYLPLELNTECCICKDSKGFPKNITNREKEMPGFQGSHRVAENLRHQLPWTSSRRCLVWVCQGVFDSGASS